MRQNFSSPSLSLSPHLASSPPKNPTVLPATAPTSPEFPPVDSSESTQEPEDMRATHIRPRTAPSSPERPGTAHSARSTIRQVHPSPDSLSEAFADGFADGSMPVPVVGASFEPFPPFNSAQTDIDTMDDHHSAYIPSNEPTTAASSLRRGGSPRKSRSYSPQKSRSQSPRKHLVRTPTLPAHQESCSSSYSADQWEAPDTPSPVTQEQKRDAYAPLQVRRPFVEANREGEPADGQGTHARIADYMREAKSQQRGRKSNAIGNNVLTCERGNGSVMPEQAKRLPLAVPHIVSAMAPPMDRNQILHPFSAGQSQVHKDVDKEPVHHVSVSRRSEASGTSMASKHSIFSTPGRDEMERKKPVVEEDEGPFAEATGMRDLEQKRRRVSEATGEEDEKGGTRRFCGMRCVMM